MSKKHWTAVATFSLGVTLGVGGLTGALYLHNARTTGAPETPFLPTTGRSTVIFDQPSGSATRTLELPELGADVTYTPGHRALVEFEVTNNTLGSLLTITDSRLAVSGPLAPYLIAEPLRWDGWIEDDQCVGGVEHSSVLSLAPGESLTVCAAVEMDFAAGNESQNLAANVEAVVDAWAESTADPSN